MEKRNMVRSKVSRAVAAVGAVALATMGVAALGSGSASAAQGSYSWSDGNDGLTRTISEVNPAVGDTITVWTTIQRNGGVVEYVQAAKDAHPACWKYVPGSAQVNGNAKGLDSSAPGDANNMGWQKVTGSWPIYPNINPRTVWFTMKYTIGADCPTGVPMKGSFFYSGTLGDGNENNVGPAVTVQAPVAQNTTTTVQAPGTATTGQAVNLTATVSPAAAGGTVQFKDNGANIGSPVTVANGTATLSHTFNTAAAHSITAVFAGATGFKDSTSAASTVTVSDPAPVDQDTTTTVQAPGTAMTGQAVNLTATVSPAAAGGTVQFKDNGADIGSPVTVANGSATLSQTFNSAGAHSITAAFSGATGFKDSTSAASTVTVTDPIPVSKDTTTTLQAPATAITGQAVHLTATVAPTPNGGTVQFKDNGANIGSPVTVNNGTATLSQTFNNAAAHSITAVFSGSEGFEGSTSAASAITVTDPTPTDQDTTTTVQVPATATAGQSVDLVATVAPATASGTVQFKDGSTDIGGPVTIVNGKATLSYIFTTAGARDITAVYSGGQGYSGSTSGQQTVTVAASGGDGGTGGNNGGTGNTGGGGSLKNIFGS
jgi:hypothetical protein